MGSHPGPRLVETDPGSGVLNRKGMAKHSHADQPAAADMQRTGVGNGMSRRRDHHGGDIDDWPEVLLLADMAELLRCSPSTIKRRLRAGVFPIGALPAIDRKRRWSKAAVWKWLEASGANRLPPRRWPGKAGGPRDR